MSPFKIILTFMAGETAMSLIIGIHHYFREKYYLEGFNDGYKQGMKDGRKYKRI